jgi:DNA-binding CsgD family transcriptional regulator
MSTTPITRPVPPRLKGRKIIKVGALTYAQLIKYMLEGIHSCQELAELTGLHYMTVLDYTRELHRAGAAHISAWEKDARGRDVIKIYSLGPGKDKKRERMTPAQRQAKARSKRQHIDMMHRMAA